LIYFQTNASADKEKVVTIDIANEDNLIFKDLIPEDKEAKLDDVTIVQDKIVVVYSRNVGPI
jgi:protease II